MASRTGEKAAASAIILLALTMYPLELVPFASSIPSALILLFGVGFVTKDGLLLLVTWCLTACGMAGITYLIATQIL